MCFGIIREKFDMVFSTVGKAYSVMILQHSRDTRSVIYFLTVGKAREVASVTCAVLTFHHHTDDPVDSGRNIVERHTLVNPVTVSRDVVNNKGFAVNAHPYRKQQYVKKNGYPAIYWYTLRYQ